MKKNILHILTNFPGRTRFKFKDRPSKLPNLDSLLKINGVEEITYNSMTYSLLVIYDYKIISFSGLIKKLKEKIPNANFSERLKETDDVGMEDKLSQIIYGATRKTNRKVQQKLQGYADLTSIVPSLLFAGGIGSLMAKPLMPKWYDFIWYAYNIFLHHSKDHHNKEH